MAALKAIFLHTLILVLFAVLTATGLDLIAADSSKTHHIGVMLQPVPSQAAGLREGLRELGYVEGKNILIDWRPSAARNEELQSVATSLARSGVELIVASGTPAARAAQATNLPVVFLAIDPIASGLVASLAEPSGNCTGISALGAELTAKRLEFLQAFVPQARRIVYFMNSTNPSATRLLENARDAAGALGLQLIVLDARNAEEIDAAFRAIPSKGTDGILFAPDFLFLQYKEKLIQGLRASRLPAIFPEKEAGLVMSYGPDLKDAMRRAAVYVDKILNGARPSDLPVEQVSKYELVINLRAARAMRLEVPKALLLRADAVIE